VIREYRWDQQNRLVRLLAGPHESVYEYDGQSRRFRITEKENSVQTKQETFVWCGSRICQKRSGSTVVRSYFGQGFEQGSADYFYTRDHLGSVREVLGSDGATVASRVSYDPWGNPAESGAGVLTDLGFTGHYLDRPSGLNLPLHRGYSPSLGRWLSRDPIGIRGGLNLYGYVLNDSVNLIDPNGHEVIPFPIPWWGPAGAGAGVGVASAGLPGAIVGACIGVLLMHTGDNAQVTPSDNTGDPPPPPGGPCLPCDPPPPPFTRDDTTHDRWPCPGAHRHFYVPEVNQNLKTCKCYPKDGELDYVECL
jgi:RHS repeat-associated protein